jgi:hypothetical protein
LRFGIDDLTIASSTIDRRRLTIGEFTNRAPSRLASALSIVNRSIIGLQSVVNDLVNDPTADRQ